MSARAGSNPWLIAILVAVASFMEVLDTTIANVLLQYIAGGMGVSEDEASWVVTTYLVANAVSLTASSYLTQRLGRKSFFLICLALFTASSVLCAYAWNLQSMLLFRIVQGLGGGGMVPVAQSILADAFPAEKRSQGFALFGVAVVVAPVVGPLLGGWLADNYSWRWAFLINAPVGLITMGLIAAVLREPASPAAQRQRQPGDGFDIGGFVLVATFLGAIELTLDRGLEDDWFGSNFIVGVAVVCALAFVLMIPWEISRRNPAVDLRMIATRQFGACFLVMLATGALLFGTTQFLPQLVQQDFGYTATWAGLVLSPGGVVTMVMMFIVGRLSGKIQPRYLIAVGAVVIALSMYVMTNVYADLGFWFMAGSRMLFGVGVPLVFIPITAASYDGLQPGKTDQASAMLNAAQYRRLARHRAGTECALGSRTIVPEPACRPGDPIERAVSGCIASGNELLPRAGQWALAGPAAGDPVGRTAGRGTGVVPRLHGRVLDTDADLARGGAAGSDLAQDQARRRRSYGPLAPDGEAGYGRGGISNRSGANGAVVFLAA
jgi:MFS transporter, DHA2 family, multidrug resistance protein